MNERIDRSLGKVLYQFSFGFNASWDFDIGGLGNCSIRSTEVMIIVESNVLLLILSNCSGEWAHHVSKGRVDCNLCTGLSINAFGELS